MTLSTGIAGYASSMYAEALSEFGIPLALKHSGGWLLRRTITDFECEDAMWPYPIFSCSNWSMLRQDLDELEAEGSLVSDGVIARQFFRRSNPWLPPGDRFAKNARDDIASLTIQPPPLF